jgi:hypothetical protein
MKHYVTYHNTEKMGYPCDETNIGPFSIVTDKPVSSLRGNTLWLISGEGEPREYALCSVFVVDEVGSSEESGYKHFAGGKTGSAFRPPIRLNDLHWFRDFLGTQQNFRFGLNEIKEQEYINELERLAGKLERGDRKPVHICVGSLDDIALLKDLDKTDKQTVWPLPKNAAIGDTVFFLAPSIYGDLLAKGEVLSKPKKSKNWQPKYEAKIGGISVLPYPIPIEILKSQIPKWDYLKYARSLTTVPPKYVRILLEIVAKIEASEDIFPEEVIEPEKYYEGTTRQIAVNVYERNPLARKKCLEHYGYDCFICDFNFEEKYGKAGAGFIHVHHLTPLSEIGVEYELDPVKDLRPVCPNCHAMIHKGKPAYTIEEMKKMVKN